MGKHDLHKNVSKLFAFFPQAIFLGFKHIGLSDHQFLMLWYGGIDSNVESIQVRSQIIEKHQAQKIFPVIDHLWHESEISPPFFMLFSRLAAVQAVSSKLQFAFKNCNLHWIFTSKISYVIYCLRKK